MFSKKCPKCANSIKKVYDFCPYCGHNLKSKFDDQDYGILGKNDFVNELNSMPGMNNPFFEGIFNKALKEMPSIMKMIEKQMNEMENNPENSQPKIPNNLKVQFFVNGKQVPLNGNKGIMNSNNNNNNNIQKPEHLKIEPKITKERKERLASLPREEAKSKPVKRISGKIIYELSVPGVKDLDDILINQLESSIEIKAISDKKVYSKTLNIKLPILSYSLDNESLILELQGQN